VATVLSNYLFMWKTHDSNGGRIEIKYMKVFIDSQNHAWSVDEKGFQVPMIIHYYFPKNL
jgi:carbamoylphosphate synthase small subunit